jgi:hypothetical protein
VGTAARVAGIRELNRHILIDGKGAGRPSSTSDLSFFLIAARGQCAAAGIQESLGSELADVIARVSRHGFERRGALRKRRERRVIREARISVEEVSDRRDCVAAGRRDCVAAGLLKK